MVSNHTLAALCVHHGLHKHVQYANFSVDNVKGYIFRLENLRKVEYERAVAEQRSPGQYWLEVEPPKVSVPQLIY